MKSIRENVSRVLAELPAGVELVAAAKARQPREVLAAVEAGVKIIGENYVQDAEKAFQLVGRGVEWHFIGHLQRNKVKKAIKIFDMIETVDSATVAELINRQCVQINRVMPVLIEVNSGREKNKSGVFPEDVEGLVRGISALVSIKIMGLMTVGPRSDDPEDARSYLKETRSLFDEIGKLGIPGVEMKYLSMGMTDTYRIALEEGANIVRLGTKIFGERY